MARPLTGSKWEADGRFGFSCPEVRGSTRRRQGTFDTAEQRDRYADAALAALRARQPLPDPEAFRSSTSVRAADRPRDFASVANSWFSAHHQELRRAGADRAEEVRRLKDDVLIPYFAARVSSVEDLSQDLAIEFYTAFRAGRPGTLAAAGSTAAVDCAEPVTLAEAARLVSVSLSSVKRAADRGLLPSLRLDPERRARVIDPSDLHGAGLSKRPGRARSAGYARLPLDVLKQICVYARANGLDVPDVTAGLRLRDDRNRAPQTPLTFTECRRLAGHLHAVWQIVLWLMRCTGLRVSEAFGLQVQDVLDLGDGGLLQVQRQGGRTFRVYDDDGQPTKVASKNVTKTSASVRVIVVSEPVMVMLRVVIDAFHADPRTGLVDVGARLVPGIADPNRGGQAGFWAALAKAARAEGLTGSSLDRRISSHLLRKSLSTDLAWTEGLEDAVRRRYVGQRAGDDVFGRVYTLDHPDLAPTRPAALAVGALIEAEVGTLQTPTAARAAFRRGNPLRERADHTNAVLDAAGWQQSQDTTTEPLLDTSEVARELEVSVTTARRWMAEGVVPTVVITVARQRPQRLATLSAVLTLKDRLSSQIELLGLAAELNLGYHQARSLLLRLGRRPRLDPQTRMLLLTDDDADALRQEVARLGRLHGRSMRIADAAGELQISVNRVNALLRSSVLVLDAETDAHRAKYVTRQSVECERLRRQGPPRSRPSGPAMAAVTLSEAARLTGLAKHQLTALSVAGHLERCDAPRARTWAVTRESLQSWATGHRPDLLHVLSTAPPH